MNDRGSMCDIEQNMCTIQDIMHVLKKIRNNIESSKLSHKSKPGWYPTLNGKPIVWDHWQQCYEFYISQGLQMNNKLSDEHFDLTPTSKMRNELAVNVLRRVPYESCAGHLTETRRARVIYGPTREYFHPHRYILHSKSTNLGHYRHKDRVTSKCNPPNP